MATYRQIVSNRKNAAKSTGPVSEEGKEVSRRNALRHGMSSKILLPEEHAEKLESRLSGFKASIEIRNELQEFQIGEAAAASLKVEICRIEAQDRRVEIAFVADSDTNEWDDERWEEALTIASTLNRNPQRALARLRKLPAGRKWLIEQWELLFRCLDPMGRLCIGRDQKNLILDLMGEPRREPDELAGFLREVLQNDPRELILAQIAELKELSKHDDLRNEFLRGQHRRGLELHDDAKLKRILRYEQAARNVYRASIAAIEKANAEAAKAAKLATQAQSRKENPKKQANPKPTTPTPHNPYEVRPNVRIAEAVEHQAEPQVEPTTQANPDTTQTTQSPQSTSSATSSQMVFRGNRRQRKAQEAKARRLANRGKH